MAGREGLFDTAVKTSRSGYLQRCLIKHLEPLTVAYDYTVRSAADGSVVQFVAGEDGLDPTRVSFLKKPGFFAANAKALNAKWAPPPRAPKALTAEAALEEQRSRQRAIDEAKATKSAPPPPPLSLKSPGSALGVVPEAFDAIIDGHIPELEASAPPPRGKADKKADKKSDKKADKKGGESRPGSSPLSADDWRVLMWRKYHQALHHPGEAVGLLAAQSVGEPSTQMTLNTFHLAGRGEANVTLGIPRMREIIMVASKKPSTPLMTLPLKPLAEGAAPGAADAIANKLAAKLSRMKLSDMVMRVSAEERLRPERAANHVGHNAPLKRRARVQLHLGRKDSVTRGELASAFALGSGAFLPELRLLLTKKVKLQLKAAKVTLSSRRAGRGSGGIDGGALPGREDADGGDDDDDDGGAGGDAGGDAEGEGDAGAGSDADEDADDAKAAGRARRAEDDEDEADDEDLEALEANANSSSSDDDDSSSDAGGGGSSSRAAGKQKRKGGSKSSGGPGTSASPASGRTPAGISSSSAGGDEGGGGGRGGRLSLDQKLEQAKSVLLQPRDGWAVVDFGETFSSGGGDSTGAGRPASGARRRPLVRAGAAARGRAVTAAAPRGAGAREGPRTVHSQHCERRRIRRARDEAAQRADRRRQL